jgi:hypothetical protein
MSAYRTSISLLHVCRSCQESCQELDKQRQYKQSESLTGLAQAQGLIQRPSARITKELLNLKRNPLQWVVGLLNKTLSPGRTPSKMGLTDRPISGRCLERDESATHILCKCEAIAYLGLHHLGHYFMEPDDYHDALINRILHSIWSVGLLKGSK